MFGRRSQQPEETTFTPAPVLPTAVQQPAFTPPPEPSPASIDFDGVLVNTEVREIVRERLMKRIEPGVAIRMRRDRLRARIGTVVAEIANEERLQLNQREQDHIADEMLDDMIGVGPIEPLLSDEAVTDILVNGPSKVFVERNGVLELTKVTFRDNAHVQHVAQRIAAAVGRRVDESSPMVDARLADGSRVNVVSPPLALDGTCISIRKFPKRRASFDEMAQRGNLSPQIARFLEIAAAIRLNVLIAGGTGAGKTTLLNAMSRLIGPTERIVTIEDAAELQLQQPHVVRLETRPLNTEGQGEVTQRDLVRNALRMRPDRIILGEVRGPEAFDMLQAMNTGHDGSMSTLHANNPREALVRLENMLLMGSMSLPVMAIRRQIVGSVQLIIQIARMRDGVRRVQQVTEIVGMEGDVIVTQDLFSFEFEEEGADGKLQGSFKTTGVRPQFLHQARMFGMEDSLLKTLQ